MPVYLLPLHCHSTLTLLYCHSPATLLPHLRHSITALPPLLCHGTVTLLSLLCDSTATLLPLLWHSSAAPLPVYCRSTATHQQPGTTAAQIFPNLTQPRLRGPRCSAKNGQVPLSHSLSAKTTQHAGGGLGKIKMKPTKSLELIF